jgi:hypothetical protein
MTTINPLHPQPEYQEWVKSLPEEVVTNTFNTRMLQDSCRNAEANLAEQVVAALETKAWERGIAVVCNGVPQVKTFDSWIDMCRAYPDQGGLNKDPSWFFRKVTTELIGDDSIKAAKLLAQNMSRGELLAYCRDTPRQKGFISIAKGNVLSHGPDWAGVVNLLEELSKKGKGGQPGNANANTSENESDDTSHSSSKVSATSKEALRRRLVATVNDDDKPAAERNRAMDGIAVLDRNGTYRAACEAAGVENKQQSKVVYVRKDLAVTADRLVELLGKDHVAELITLLTERITND